MGMNPPWATLIAGIGIGTIVAALVAARMTKAVAIAGHRQAWINALRDHLSDYFHMIDRLSAARKRHDTGGPAAVAEARQTAKKEYRQILLRLNAGEKQHQALSQLLLGLLDDTDEVQLEKAMLSSRSVLKREWEVTKGYTIKRLWRGARRRLRRSA